MVCERIAQTKQPLSRQSLHDLTERAQHLLGIPISRTSVWRQRLHTVCGHKVPTLTLVTPYNNIDKLCATQTRIALPNTTLPCPNRKAIILCGACTFVDANMASIGSRLPFLPSQRFVCRTWQIRMGTRRYSEIEFFWIFFLCFPVCLTTADMTVNEIVFSFRKRNLLNRFVDFVHEA